MKHALLINLATLMPDYSPQITPVWFNTDGDTILINSAKGRVKDKNMRLRPSVALCIQYPVNPYRCLQLRGRVIDITEKGADAHIDKLAGKYTGVFKFQHHISWMKRGICKILPLRIDAHG